MEWMVGLIETQGVATFALVVYAFLTWKTLVYLRERDKAIADDKVRDDEINNKLIDMLGGFKEAVENGQKSIERMNNENIIIRQSAQTIVAENTEALKQHTQGIRTMSDKFEELESAVSEALSTIANVFESGVKLSDKAKTDIITEITDNLRVTMKQCLRDAIRSTQESQKIESETPETPLSEDETEQE